MTQAWKDCPTCGGKGEVRYVIQARLDAVSMTSVGMQLDGTVEDYKWIPCPICKAHFDAMEEACAPLRPNMLLKFAWCSIGRPGFIYGRKEMPWGMAWIGWGLDGKGDWSSRNPKEMTPYEVMKVVKKLSGNATEEDT